MTLMGINRRLSTPYHPISNGMVERLGGNLKRMLTKLKYTNENWDQFIPGELFANHEIPHYSTGYSPFELGFGRKPTGPSDILADAFSGQDNSIPEYMFVTDYVNKLRDNLKTTQKLAHEYAQDKLAEFRDQKNKHRRANRDFDKGNRVLILLPKDGNNLLMTFQGPYEIVNLISLCPRPFLISLCLQHGLISICPTPVSSASVLTLVSSASVSTLVSSASVSTLVSSASVSTLVS
ncbi:Pol polyprotein [Plakobranchus ocellatus]|uniref:Pol polyprotein n=1 Tax=Plakobranchus ocellatus TaxID=259542 RepID=A0AAV4D1T7_9GAST|nr:Pol polyprotein [Plakobranchus ocellatus]